jgi:hypothetical protein
MRKQMTDSLSSLVAMRLTSSVVGRILAVGLFFMPGYAAGGGSNAHAPIVIQSDADFITCACVVSGDGTQASPYVVGPWTINKNAGAGVTIDGTSLTKSFVLWNLTIAGNGGSGSQGILLKNINPSGSRSIVAEVKAQGRPSTQRKSESWWSPRTT